MKKSILTIILIVMMLSSLFIGQSCGKKEKDVVKIGVISSLTGTVAPYGKRAYEGIELAAEEINKKGGINNKKVLLIIEDDKSTTNGAVQAFKKLVEIDKVPVILGPVGSSQAMACAPMANEKRVIEFSPAAATPLYSTTGDYTFRNRASATLEVEVMADVAYLNLGLRKMAILYINNDVGVGFYPVFKERFENHNGKIVLIESFEQNSSDMRTQLTKIKNSNVDGVYLIGHVLESAYVLKQAKELGIKLRFVGHLALEGPDLFKVAGDAAEGVVYTATGYNPNSTDSLVQSFEKKYQSEYGKEGDVFAATAYDAMYIIKIAIEEGGYNSEGIKKALYNIKDFKGVTGLTSFDDRGDVIKPVFVKIVKNQKFVVVDNLDNLK